MQIMFPWNKFVLKVSSYSFLLHVFTSSLQVHECSECGRGFAHRGNMLRHMILHDPNNPEYQTLLELENAKMEELDSSQIQYVQILEDEDHPTVKADGSLHQGPVQLQLVSDGTEDAIYLQMGEPGLPSNETTDVLEPKSGVHPKDEDAIQHVILSMPESEQAKLDLSTVEEDIRSVGLSNNVDAKPDGLSDATFFNLNNSDVSESNAVDKAEIQDVPRGDQVRNWSDRELSLHGGPSEAGDCSHPPPKMATAENPLSR